MIRAHVGGAPSKPEPGFLVEELQAPRSERRADALWLPLSSQQRGEIHGFEVKVSRGDLMVELADPTKADAWLQYCDRWWLAIADPAMLRGLEVPEHWGILTPPTGRSKRLMTVQRPAPKLKPAGQSAALATVLTRLYYGGGSAPQRIAFLEHVQDDLQARVDTWQQRAHDAEAALRKANLSPDDAAIVNEVLHQVKVLPRRDRTEWRYLYPDLKGREDLIAAALLDRLAVERATAQLLNRIERVRKDAEGLGTEVTRVLTERVEELEGIGKRMREALEVTS